MNVAPGIVGDFSALASAFKATWDAKFADVEKDLVTLEDVAAICDDLGVPDAKLAETILGALAVLASLKAQAPAATGDAPWWTLQAGPGYRPGPTWGR